MRRLVLVALLVAMAQTPDARADIAGGRETDRAWPWIAKVSHGRTEAEQNEVGFLCGATLVTSTWALTAAHCVETPEVVAPHLLYLTIGRHNWHDTSQGELIRAKRVLINPGFDVSAQFRGDISGSDVALIELERPAATEGVKIAGPGEEPLWAPGIRATILGWGNHAEGGSYDLMEAQIPIISDADCETRHAAEFDAETMLCASDREQGIGTCSGDSGGPLLVVTRSGAHRQAGVTSWGSSECGEPGKTSAFARVAGPALRDWIAAIVPEAIGRAEPEPPPPPPPVEAPPAPATQSRPPSPAPAAQPKKPSRRTSQRARRRKACLRRAKTRAARKRCVKRYRLA